MAGKVGCWCCRLRGGLSAGVWWAKGGWLLGGSWRGWVVAAGEAAAAARCVVGVCVVVQPCHRCMQVLRAIPEPVQSSSATVENEA